MISRFVFFLVRAIKLADLSRLHHLFSVMGGENLKYVAPLRFFFFFHILAQDSQALFCCFVMFVVVLFANISIIKFSQIFYGSHRRQALRLLLAYYSISVCSVICVSTVTLLTANTGVCTREGQLQLA